MAIKPGCRALREQDEYHCAFCGYRWSVDEEPPQCKTVQERMKPTSDDRLVDAAKEMRKYHSRGPRGTRIG